MHAQIIHFWSSVKLRKGSFKKQVRWVKEAGGLGVIEKWTKVIRGREILEHMCKFGLKKNAEIFKMKFCGYSPVFPIDYNGCMKY